MEENKFWTYKVTKKLIMVKQRIATCLVAKLYAYWIAS
uniref:Uncharacterized protein n=1 Tax=Rhizophora mucronata TaxID=61149 RepID=A0A2P2NNU5_RHIMU